MRQFTLYQVAHCQMALQIYEERMIYGKSWQQIADRSNYSLRSVQTIGRKAERLLTLYYGKKRSE